MYIYKITNILNGKIYIGLKCSLVEESTEYYGSGIGITAAIKKYGREQFTKEILERDIESYELLCEREIYWIAYYNSNDKNIGYNRTIGGDGVRGYELTDEQRENRSKIASDRKWYYNPITHERVHVKEKPEGWVEGRFITEKEKTQIKKSREGKKLNIKDKESKNKKISNALKGFKHTDESIELMRIGQKGRNWYHNPETGEVVQSIEVLQSPWKRGTGTVQASVGNKWYYNHITGKTTKSKEDLPYPWIRGRIIKKS